MAYICLSRVTSANPPIAQDTFQKDPLKSKKKISKSSKNFEKFEIFEKKPAFFEVNFEDVCPDFFNLFLHLSTVRMWNLDISSKFGWSFHLVMRY